MTGHAEKRCEEKLGLAGLSMDALAVIQSMAQPSKVSAHRVVDEEILLRAVLLQSGAANDHGLRVIEPARFGEKMKALACGGVSESLCARMASRFLGPEAAHNLFPSAAGI